MTTDETSLWIDAAAANLGIAIDPAWKPNVAMFVEVARSMARLVDATQAAPSIEGAPVFTPRDAE